MQIKDIVKGLESNSITVNYRGHLTNPIENYLQDEEEGIFRIRQSINPKIHCFNCDKEVKLAFDGVDKTNIISFAEDCEAKDLYEAKKLEATINFPTGNVVFTNFFHKEEIYINVNNRYGRPSICSLLGRKALMDYLATKNVGYGQMGNMSISVYSNKTEIIITETDLRDSYGELVESVLSEEEEYTEEEVRDAKNAKTVYDDFFKYLKDNKFKKRGDISLSVWRWMCADKATLELEGEEIDDDVNFKVDKGLWKIEHYFDFTPCNPKTYKDLIYSKLSKL